MIQIREERPEDIQAIYNVNSSAFETHAEAILVDKLRAANAITLSLIAEENGEIVGHILFSPVTITDGDQAWSAVGLGPMAVTPKYQNRGIGSLLVRASLKKCRELGEDVVVVLGHAEYYPRFGFRPSKPLGITWEIEVPEEVFMVAELREGALAGRKGIVRYRPEFEEV
jgi:putative acetyltransferase